MNHYKAPLDNMNFLLFDTLKANKISECSGFEDATEDLFKAIMEEAAKFSENVLLPINAQGDREGCQYDPETHTVTTPSGFKEAYQRYMEGGWSGLSASPDFGGQGLPHLLKMIVDEKKEFWPSSIEHTYIFQTSPCLGLFTKTLPIKEAQRQLAFEDDDTTIIPTSAMLQKADKCHFEGIGGYDKFGERLFNLSRGKSVAVKNFIMNARVVVGVGNIYASEALFKAGIHPKRAVSRISLHRYQELVVAIKTVLAEAIEAGGTTLQDFSNSDGKPGYFQQQLLVYGRDGQACTNCQQAIKKITIGNRSSYYCPRCQH